MLTEVNVLRKLCHDNIIALINVFVDRKSKMSSKNVYFVFNPAVQDLHEFIRNQKSLLDKAKIMKFMKMLVDGLCYIHRSNFIHRDIKPSNVLIFPGEKIKICDFGLTWKSGEHKLTRFGTSGYMAPEMLLESYEYDFKIDVWVS